MVSLFVDNSHVQYNGHFVIKFLSLTYEPVLIFRVFKYFGFIKVAGIVIVRAFSYYYDILNPIYYIWKLFLLYHYS